MPDAPKARLAANNYGKSGVRFLKVRRDGSRHDIVELTVAISLEGDFDAIHEGDNTRCIPTDTMKNTVYALGKDHPVQTIESFAEALARHFLGRPHVHTAGVEISQTPWERVHLQGRPHPHTFTMGSSERATCTVSLGQQHRLIKGGIQGLVILKSTDSAFSGFPRDCYTTLKETEDRIFATSLTARWTYDPTLDAAATAPARSAIRAALIDTFATHQSRSVQHTMKAMAQAALDACPQALDLHLSMPNKHCLLVDLAPFGLENHNEVFVPTTEPYGLIEAAFTRP